jgi:hypothetical protein
MGMQYAGEVLNSNIFFYKMSTKEMSTFSGKVWRLNRSSELAMMDGESRAETPISIST